MSTAAAVSAANAGSASCRPETLTPMVHGPAVPYSRFQAASRAHASASSQRPIGTTRPVRSAVGMNRTGGTGPRVGWFQRTRVSMPMMRCSTRCITGWKTG